MMPEDLERERLHALLREAAERLRGNLGATDLLRRIDDELGVTREQGMAEVWKAFLVDHVRKVGKQLESDRRSLASCQRDMEPQPGEDPSYVRKLQKSTREVVPIYEDAVRKGEAKLARATRNLQLLEEDQGSVFLPLGTPVMIREIPPAQNGYPVPVPGTIAVVVGYDLGRDGPNTVALPVDGRDTGGRILRFDEESPVRYSMSADELEPIGPALLPGDVVNEAPGYRATHVRFDEDGEEEDRRTEMLIQAEGRFWRIAEINGVAECLGAYPDEASLSWLRPIPGEPDLAGDAPAPGR